MKKLLVLPLFIGAIALSSCSGASLSLDDAKQRLENVIALATENGKYIGGKFLTRESTRSNIIYDIEAAVVETHEVVKDYYFDIDNNYFRFDATQTDVVVYSEDNIEKKVVEIECNSGKISCILQKCKERKENRHRRQHNRDNPCSCAV